jgi:glucose/arabinose dehydrogenase
VEYGLTTSYGTSSPLNSALVTSHTVTLSGLTGNTIYHYRVKSKDASGNLAASDDFTFTTTADEKSPVISAVAASNLTASAATITWTTDEASDTQAEYGFDAAYGSLSPLNSALLTSHTVRLSGLASNTTYHYRVKSKDASSNLAMSGDFTFTTTSASAYTQRVNAGGSSYTGNGETWAADQAYSNGGWGYVGGETFVTSASIANTTDDPLYRSERWEVSAYRFTVPGIGPYRVELHFAEIAFNAREQRIFDVLLENQLVLDNLDIYAEAGANTALVYTFATEVHDGILDIAFHAVVENPKISAIEVVNLSSDGTPPVISNIASSNLTALAATITWTTDEASDSQIEYGLDATYGSTSSLNSALVTSHALTLSGLASNTTYHYRVKSKDAAGNLATSVDAVFTTHERGQVAFANVQGIFNNNCVRCHQGVTAPEGLVLLPEQSYANLVNAQSREYPQWQRVQSNNRTVSWIYEKITNPAPPVGSQMGSLTADEIELIGLWIDQGATEVPEPPYADLEIRTTSLPNGEINIFYEGNVVVWGGLPPYQFSLVNGELPSGVNLDTASGRISGVPTTTGEYNFTILVSDSQSPPVSIMQGYYVDVRHTQAHWQVPPDFEIQPVVTDLQLPVNIAFVPNPGPNPTDPYFYVTLLYGDIVMVQRNFEKQTYASNLLNFAPNGQFPGSGEMGVIGIVVEPVSGDVFASMVYEVGGYLYGKVDRFHSTDGGHTAATQTTIFSGVPAGPSHQIQALTIGPDGKLYVNTGDGLEPNEASNLADWRGKILRMNLDGSMPEDNPFPNSYVYASGFRNHFGAAWRPADGKLYISDNGPEYNDRLVKVNPGEDYGWREVLPDLTQGAIFLWNPTVSPVAMDFVKDSAFPPDYQGQLFVGLSGEAYILGTTERGKKIQRFILDENGQVVDNSIFLDYIGVGRSTVVGLAFGPDGLYFTDLFSEDGFNDFGETRGNVFRIRWIPGTTAASKFDAASTAEYTPVETIPSTFALHNYPNPFNLATKIRLALPEEAEVQLSVFDLSGREVKELLSGSRPAGHHEVIWDGRNRRGMELSTGYYLVRWRYRTNKAGSWSQQVRRVMMVK